VPKYSLPGAIRFTDAMKPGRKLSMTRVPIGHDDLAFLQYTGGTTGIAKGAMLLHRNIVANMLQARAWVRPILDDNRREVILTPLPLYHIFALTANCLVFMSVGGENVLITNPRDIPHFVKEMRRYRFTAMTGVNTLFNALLNNPKFAQLSFKSFRLTPRRRNGRAGSGGQAVEGGYGRDACRSVRPHRDVAGGDDESARCDRIHRSNRSARSRRPTSRCATMRARTCRSGRPAKSASAARR
jgi:acyl-CoA synthetase (AMP-forming)/AMP-acid ligase II